MSYPEIIVDTFYLPQFKEGHYERMMVIICCLN